MAVPPGPGHGAQHNPSALAQHSQILGNREWITRKDTPGPQQLAETGSAGPLQWGQLGARSDPPTWAEQHLLPTPRLALPHRRGHWQGRGMQGGEREQVKGLLTCQGSAPVGRGKEKGRRERKKKEGEIRPAAPKKFPELTYGLH